jgi:hypothetical protein
MKYVQYTGFGDARVLGPNEWLRYVGEEDLDEVTFSKTGPPTKLKNAHADKLISSGEWVEVTDYNPAEEPELVDDEEVPIEALGSTEPQFTVLDDELIDDDSSVDEASTAKASTKSSRKAK